VWNRPQATTDAFARWRAGLPAAVTTGDLDSQHQLDTWAKDHTLGLIDHFPITLTPDTLLVLGTALATRVSWERPFAVVPAVRLGPTSAWAPQLRAVLRTPGTDGHTSSIVATERAGDVAVHTAEARDGLSVTSVLAAPEVPAADVLAAAHQVATGDGGAPRSLFDLPLGEGPLWTLREQPTRTSAGDGREEALTATLPAWSMRGDHNLEHPDLGFPAAAAALDGLLDGNVGAYSARQSVMARYSRVGFEAAAATAMGERSARPSRCDGVLRIAELRFGHPFAVVAVATDRHYDRVAQAWVGGPWHRLPVFSAWVVDPDDADPDDADPATKDAPSPGPI
jgi:hypothetical protein